MEGASERARMSRTLGSAASASTLRMSCTVIAAAAAQQRIFAQPLQGFAQPKDQPQLSSAPMWSLLGRPCLDAKVWRTNQKCSSTPEFIAEHVPTPQQRHT